MEMTDNERDPLIPLGFFAVLSYTRAEERARRVLRSLQGGLREDPRPIIPYLRSGRSPARPDGADRRFVRRRVLGSWRFGNHDRRRVFWRVDTAETTSNTHRVALPSDFL